VEVGENGEKAEDSGGDDNDFTKSTMCN